MRYDLDKCRAHLPLYTIRFTVVVTECFSGFLYNLCRKPKNLEKMHNKCTGTAVKTDTKAIDALLRIDDSKLSWPGRSSYSFS